jgi:hypothetical protein
MGYANVNPPDNNGFINALYSLLTTGTDYYGNAVPNTVLSWTKDSTTGSQAIYSSTFGPRNFRLVIASQDSGTPSPSPTMLSPDAYSATRVFVGLANGASGAYTNWYASSPFQSAGFAGLTGWSTTSATNSTKIHVWTSDKGFVAVTEGSSAGNQRPIIAGAVLNGSGQYFESDGYRYGIINQSYAFSMNNSFRINGYFLNQSDTPGDYHAGAYVSGSSTWEKIDTLSVPLKTPYTTAGFGKWDASRYAPVPIAMARSDTPFYTVGNLAGVYEGPASTFLATISSGGEVVYWGISYSVSAVGDTAWISKTY